MCSRICRRTGSVLCAIALVLWLCTAFFVSYADSSKGSLTIVCKSDNEPLYGMNWKIFAAGKRVSDNKIEFTGDFADYPVFLPDLETSSLQDAANTLENYAVLDSIEPFAKGSSDPGGNVTFTGMADGIYLVTGDKLSIGSRIYIPMAMFVEITGGKAVNAYAKFTVRQKPSFDDQMYRVRKVWQYDDSFIQLRPVEIKVEIYRNNEYVETVTLNKQNEWTYDWTGDASSSWRVKEINIQGNYKVVYRNNETQYILVNSRDVLYNTTTSTETATTVTTTETTSVTSSDTGTGTETSDTGTGITTSDTVTETTLSTDSTSSSTDNSYTETKSTTGANGGGKLPQTGQLWWPVPVCGAAGIILFAVGWRLNKKK